MRAVRPVLCAVWVFGGALTLWHAGDPARLAVDSPSSSAVLETAAGCGVLLLALLSYGRWRDRRLAPDLVTCYAFSLLAVGNVVFTLLPTLASTTPVSESVHEAALLFGVIAAVLLATASLVPERAAAARRVRFDLSLFVVGVLAVAGAVALVAARTSGLFRDLVGLPSTDATGAADDVAVTVVQAVAATAFVIAAYRFARRARGNDDAFHGWLAVTAALWALSRISYALTPESLAPKLTIGDWLRMAAYAVAVVAAGSEFTRYWRRLAEVAVLEERRRIARELHDGLAQELAFITTQARSLAKHASPDDAVSLVARAAERSLDESRRAIAALTRRFDEPLDVAMTQQAEELSNRLGVRMVLDLESAITVAADTREALLRIAREAITNAARHGRPSKILLQLSNHDGVTLRVRDDGRGFLPEEVQASARGRYGLAGMRERAAALGGQLNVQSRPFAGTEVQVWLP